MLVVTPSFSLTPNKLVLFNRFDRTYPQADPPQSPLRHFEKPTVTRSFHNFELSPNAYRTLRQKINWLYYASRKRDITTYSGRRIFSFRCAFITFTLPSEQKTCTADVTKRHFNHCLTVLRQRFGLKNYVWRLEFQKNGNVHYHLATDSYIDFFAVKKVWNKILETDGYVSAYTQKHACLSLRDYCDLYSRGGKVPFNTLAKRYAKGCKNGWKEPNSVDVKSVVSKQAIANYISKYFGKTAKSKVMRNKLDNEENGQSLRLWFCSRGLSKLKTIADYLPHVNYDPETMVRFAKNFRRVVVKYAVIYFFDLYNIANFARRELEDIYKKYLKIQGYAPV